MPQQTNLFQEVVEIIHRHMAEDATVEASAMLPSRSTGALREVDVAIRAKQAGHEVIVSVEAISRSRKAARPWVDEMVGKHADLPTSKLVLVSEKGFTKDARKAALAADAVPLAPEDLGDNPDNAVMRVLPSLWPKAITFAPDSLSVNFTDDDAPTTGWEDDPPMLAIDDGRVVGTLWDVVRKVYEENWLDLMEQIQLRDIEKDDKRDFTLVLDPQEGDDLSLVVDGKPRMIFLINANRRGYSLRRVTVVGTVEIQVSEIPLKGARLGDVDVKFAYGEGKVGSRDALLVVTETESGGKLTMRIRPLDESSNPGGRG
jgi:hypothetical protein